MTYPKRLLALAVPSAAALASLAACGPPSPGPRVQAVLDAYAPELPVGQPVSAAARHRYRLAVTPYLGYRDSAYIAPGGLRDLQVEMDTYVDDVRPAVPPAASVASVALASPDAPTTAALEARLTAALGRARVHCYAPGSVDSSWVWRRAYWAGERGRGVLLQTARGRPAEAPGAVSARPLVAGRGVVTFGAVAPEGRIVDGAACP